MSYFSSELHTLKARAERAYSLWRIKPTKEEVHSYNQTNRVLLTFDDYTNEASLIALLNILEEKKVKAAFFIVGQWAQKTPGIFEAIKTRGHWLGNHTYSHKKLSKLTSKEAEREILQGPKAALLRPPYGAYNKRIRTIAHSLGYKIAFWNVDSDDWKGMSATDIQERVWQQLVPGACVLMHLNVRNTLEALPGMIDGIRSRGFELCFEGTEIAL